MTRPGLRRPIACLAVAVGAVFLVAAPAWAQDERDCSDFSTQQEAQRFFEAEGGPDSDPHMLDPDRDGQACEGLPTGSPAATGSPAPTVAPTATPANELPNNGAFSGILALSGLTFVEVGVGLSMLASRMRGRRRNAPLALLKTLASAAKAGRNEVEVAEDVYLVRRTAPRTPVASAARAPRTRSRATVDGIRTRRPQASESAGRRRVSLRRDEGAEATEPHDWPFFTPPGK